MSVHVFGEGLVDLVPAAPGSLSDLTPALGGGPFNVAVAAARLGADVAFQSRLSTDGFGETLVQRLQAEGVDTSHLQRGDEPTTLAVTTIGDDGSASYTFYTEGTADRLAEPVLVPADIACFGTISLALDPGASRYAALLKDYAAQGTLVALDPNIRPFYATPRHRQFLLGLMPHVTVLKLSEEELDFLGGESALDVPVMIVTCGDRGMRLHTDSLELTIPSVPVQVIDTIGAGDTVMAALLTQLDERLPNRSALADLGESDGTEVLTFAAAAASITVSCKGAQPPRRAEVEVMLSASR